MKTDMTLTLDLGTFQGPFDLLLHLIRKMEIDINDIPMQEITSQYLTYIDQMEAIQLDQIADYLLMAATLIEIKSRLLLPIEPDLDLEEDYEYSDPRHQLVQQLLLYQQFQDVADQLEAKEAQRSKFYSKAPDDLSHYQEKLPLEVGSLNLADLAQAMQTVLLRALKNEPLESVIDYQVVSVNEKISYIDQLLSQTTAWLSFDELLEAGHRSEIIATFMAILEMTRKQKIIFKQESPDEYIQVHKS